MLNWKQSVTDTELMQARVYSCAIDGTPTMMFVINARPDVYDIQTSEGYVLARECFRDKPSIERAQLAGLAAAREIIARLALSI